MRRILLGLLLSATIVGCGETDEATPPETTTTVAEATTTTAADTTVPAEEVTGEPTLAITIAGFMFSGDETGVVGDTVAVTNSDNVGHTWTSTDGAFHSGVLSNGDQFVFTFDEAGTYPFFCQIHTDMTGSITIDG
jgi:plastocyanin